MIDPDGPRLPGGPREIELVVHERLGSDLAFDRIYDEKIRALSDQHWTPVEVAVRAARMLTHAGATRILDIGSGVGKFCVVGALCTTAEFVGVERRQKLVGIAERAAAALGANRATFVHSNIDAFSLARFDGCYLYNPFYEQISKYLPMIDDDVQRSTWLNRYFIETVQGKLQAAEPPMVVVTYHGFGGSMPRGYRNLAAERAGNDRLEMWIKE